MEKKLTRDEELKTIADAKEKLKELLASSNGETQLEVVVVLRAGTEIDLSLSTHCPECALQLLHEGHDLVLKDIASNMTPESKSSN